MWYLYLLLCANDHYYCGVTKDLKRRVHQHNHTKAGARYTRANRPVKLMWAMSLPNQRSALVWEMFVKRLPHWVKTQLMEKIPSIVSEETTVPEIIIPTTPRFTCKVESGTIIVLDDGRRIANVPVSAVMTARDVLEEALILGNATGLEGQFDQTFAQVQHGTGFRETSKTHVTLPNVKPYWVDVTMDQIFDSIEAHNDTMRTRGGLGMPGMG
jgi:putative endonuclease